MTIPHDTPDRMGDTVLTLLAEHERLWSLETEEGNAAARPLLDQVRTTKPTTLAGAIAQLEFAAEQDDPDMAKTVAAGLRDIFGQGPETAAPTAAEAQREAFNIISGMEDDLRDASVLADGVAILAVDSIQDEKLGAVLMRLGWQIRDYCEALEERRGELFRLLHPNREHFEREGWPDEGGDGAA